MGILDRVSTMLRANINAILDQAEDPEKMIDQLIRDMADAIRQARAQVAEMIAQEKRLEADAERNRSLADEWERKAELALQRGADDLAKEALRRKIDYERNARVYAEQLLSQEHVVTKLKADLGALESKYDQAKRDRDVLIARHRRAVAQQRVLKTTGQLSTFDPTSELKRWEDRVQLEEARAAAHAELSAGTLESRFAELEEDGEVERQLADLRGRVRGELPAPKEAQLPEPKERDS